MIKDVNVFQEGYNAGIIGREKEVEDIQLAIKSFPSINNIYLYGTPGAGKTLLAKEIAIKGIRDIADNTKLVFININGSTIRAIKDFSKILHSGIAGNMLPKRLPDNSEIYNFLSRNERHVVIFYDEIDKIKRAERDSICYMLTRVDREMRDFFDINGIQNDSRIIFIATCNSLGFRDNLAEATLNTWFSTTREIKLENYNYEDIFRILYDRAKRGLLEDSFDKSGVHEITKWTEILFNGNVRLGIRLLFDWAEICTREGKKIGDNKIIEAMAHEVYYQTMKNDIQLLDEKDMMILATIKSIKKAIIKTGRPNNNVDLKELKNVYRLKGFTEPELFEITKKIDKMIDKNIIIANKVSLGRGMGVTRYLYINQDMLTLIESKLQLKQLAG